MKAVILAGGFGTRLSEATHLIPKPMVEIGGKPILWHIMKTYSHYGIKEFIICCGYKGYVIKEWFANYFLHTSDITFDLKNKVFDYITEGDSTIFEKAPLENIAKDGGMNSFKHEGFWKPMDILRDNKELNEMWDSGKAPWKVWE